MAGAGRSAGLGRSWPGSPWGRRRPPPGPPPRAGAGSTPGSCARCRARPTRRWWSSSPGILGSQLLRPDGTEAWLNLGNTLGHHDLSLPRKLPFASSRDELVPGFLVGTDAVLPRAFGFTEYADVLDLLDAAGFEPGSGPGLRYAVFTYDWRRDLVESARGLAHEPRGAGARDGRPRRPVPPRGPQHGRPRRPLLPALRRRGAPGGRARHLGRGAARGERRPGRDSQRRQHARARGGPRTASAWASRTRPWRRRW